jgi:hypothetical protein
MSESPSKAGPFLEGQIPALVSLAHAGFRFFLSCKSGCRVRPLSWGAPSGTDGAVRGRKVNLVFQTVEGGPRTEETACRTVYMMGTVRLVVAKRCDWQCS